MKILSWIVWLMYPVVLLVFFASLLTTNPYMQLSKGLYASHEDIFFDHDYVSRKLIDYLNYKHDDLTFGPYEIVDGPIMLDIEIRHMEDVKAVYTNLRIVAGIGFILVVSISVFLYKTRLDLFYYTYKNIFWIPLGIIVFAGTWFLIDFNRIFTWFHLLFFDNDDWLLPYHVLIPLLPQNFWLVSATLMLLGTALCMGGTVLINRKLIKPRFQEKFQKSI